MKKHYDVLIATPGHSLEAGYVKSLTETIETLTDLGISFKWLNGYSSLVHNAREITATGGAGKVLDPFHKGPMGDSVTYNKIFWIDSDISWTKEDFLKLYNSDFDIVTGAYILGDNETTSVHGLDNPAGMHKSELKKYKEPFKIRTMGFGFVSIKSGVFEKMLRPWFGHYAQQMTLQDGTTINTFLGEDISWCINAMNAGFDIYLDPSVLVGHIKKIELGWK